MEFNQERIEQAVIDQVAEGIMHEDELRSRVKQAVDARIDKHFKEIADKQIGEAITAAIKDGFEHEYCKVDYLGRREGEPTTINKELHKQIAGYWNQGVDQYGKPTSDTYSKKSTRAEFVMTQMVAADFGGEMKQHIVNVAAQLKDGLRKELHLTINKLMSEVFHVRSWDDQNAKDQGWQPNVETPKKAEA